MKQINLTIVLLFVFSSLYAVVGPISGTTVICVGNPSVLSDTSTGGSWWSSNTSVANIGSSSGIVSGLSAGTSIISYITGTGYATATLVVHALPNLYTVTGGGPYCIGGTGLPVGLSGSDGGTNYFLYIGSSITGPFPGTGGGVSFGLQTAAGTYTVEAVNSTTACSAMMTGSVTISISPIVTPSVRISANPGDTVCLGTSTIFTALPVYGGTLPIYQWQVNGLDVSTSNVYTYVPANGDQLILKLRSNANCLSTTVANDTLVMAVLPNQLPRVSVSVSPGDTICTDYLANFLATSFYGGRAPKYNWYINDVFADSGASFTTIPADLDRVKCELLSDYNCRSRDSVGDSVKMAVVTPVIPSFTINAYPGYELEIGANDTLIALVSGGSTDLSYQWSIGDSEIVGAIADTFVFNNSSLAHRTDSVSCIITSGRYCQISTSNWAYITVVDEAVPSLATSSGLELFPNPSAGRFIISGNLDAAINTQQTMIGIRDLPGRLIYQETTSITNGKINTQVTLPENIPDGLYLMDIYLGPGKKTLPFIIRR